MLSSVAERVYWMGRYLERAENTARLLNVYSAMLFDLPRGTRIGWSSLVDIAGSSEDFNQRFSSHEERTVVRYLLADPNNPSSIFNCLKMARENARTSREIIPSEVWEQINDLFLFIKESGSSGVSRGKRHQILQQVIRDSQRIAGMLHGTMRHNVAYAFTQLGSKLERADMSTRIVDVGSIALLPGMDGEGKEVRELSDPYENITWMSVLRSLSAYQAYRQHVHNRVNGEDVVRFLLQDEEFPRSLVFCLYSLTDYLVKLPRHEDVQRAAARVQRISRDVEIRDLLERGLLDFIDELQVSIGDIHSAISATWFRPAIIEEQAQTQSL